MDVSRKVFGREVFPRPHLKVPIWFGRLCLLLVLFLSTVCFQAGRSVPRERVRVCVEEKRVTEVRERGRSHGEGKTGGTNELPQGEESPLAFHRHVPLPEDVACFVCHLYITGAELLVALYTLQRKQFWGWHQFLQWPSSHGVAFVHSPAGGLCQA